MEKVRKVKDCIYGYVTIPNLCYKFLDVLELQRLRRIKQLGNAHRVYQSATHTRFEHSIGVMHLAGVLAKHLAVEEKYIPLIQLAGLYHDVGHMPYSHLFDRILEITKPKNILLEHEDRSIDTFLKVSKRLGILTDEENKFVCACIKGEFLEDNPPFYFQIVCSTIDVDKLDYLCRDAYHTGMPSFQSNYILNNTFVLDGKLAYKKKAYIDIKNMFETREKMHELVYQHRVSLEYDTMYACMISDIIHTLDFSHLCDCKLETELMTNPITKDRYMQIECRKKKHSDLCNNKDHKILTKKIPDSGNIDMLTFID